MKIIVATCQFPIDRDIGRNLGYVLRQLRAARARGAHVAHFPECALSGYPGSEFPSFAGFDWSRLAAGTRRIMDAARALRLWVILGSSHRLAGRHKPHNSLYVIDARGRIADRYDKRFCTGDARETTDDLRHYSPGDHPVVVTIRGVRCGLLICHEFRYPELYRAYLRQRVQLVFHSHHNGHLPAAQLRRLGNIWGAIVAPSMQAHAATNHFWISVTNTAARASCWPSFVVRPDGRVTGRLANNRAGILITAIDPRARFYDASAAWRGRAVRGVFHSGTLVRDRRAARHAAP